VAETNRNYLASKTGWAFHQSDEFVRGLVGPIGSGKSVACCADLMKRATEQKPARDGKRYTRWAIIRNTYRELQDTTVRTWFDWFPKELGTWRATDMEWILETSDMKAEFMFRALDRPEDVKKLLSLELTGAWVNEAKEVPRAVIDMLQGRVGRYPSKRDDEAGPSWNGIIMDTNPPDTDHWWYRLFEEDKPENWEIFHQPSGLAKNAENTQHLPDDYYTRLQAGHDQAWIDVYVHGQYGFVKDGKPVYAECVDILHALKEPPKVLRGDIYVGIDFGLTPAAVIAQQRPDGQWQVIEEVVTEDMGAVRFGESLAVLLRTNFPNKKVHAWGDPAGEQRSQVDERTPFQVMRAQGVPAVPAPSNDFTLRREAVAKNLTTLTMNGQPRLVISPSCRSLRKAMAGGYKYRRIQVGGDERFKDAPDKNMYSHVAEALQYLMIGAGEARTLIKPANDVGQYKVHKTIGGRGERGAVGLTRAVKRRRFL